MSNSTSDPKVAMIMTNTQKKKKKEKRGEKGCYCCYCCVCAYAMYPSAWAWLSSFGARTNPKMFVLGCHMAGASVEVFLASVEVFLLRLRQRLSSASFFSFSLINCPVCPFPHPRLLPLPSSLASPSHHCTARLVHITRSSASSCIQRSFSSLAHVSVRPTCP